MASRFCGPGRDGKLTYSIPFFGLTPDDKEQLILEPAFLLMYYGGFTYSEVCKLPVIYKRWFIDRIVKELNKGSDNGQNQSRALHQNTADVRSMQNKARAQTPSRLRRFLRSPNYGCPGKCGTYLDRG